MSEEVSPEQRIARRRAQREAQAHAQADKERNLEAQAKQLAAQGKINIDQARSVVRISNGPMGAAMGVVLVTATIGALIFAITWCMKPKTAEERSRDRCTIEAQLAGKAGGNPNFKYARAESPTEAKLWFSKNGVYWSTSYFCD